MKRFLFFGVFVSTCFAYSQQTITSVAHGLATNPFIWDCMCLPTPTDHVLIQHNIEMNVDWAVSSGGSITVGGNGNFNQNANNSSILFDGTGSSFNNYGTTVLSNIGFTQGAEGNNFSNLVLDTVLWIDPSSSFTNNGLVSGMDSTWNQGSFTNNGTYMGGDFLNDGALTNSGWLTTDSLYNAGSLTITAGHITAFDFLSVGTAEISGSGYIIVENDFANFGAFIVGSGRDMRVGRDFLNGNIIGGTFTNNGLVEVMRDFSNVQELNGSGVFCIGESSSNLGSVTGSLDICDNTPMGPHFDTNLGTIDPSVTSCASGCSVGLETIMLISSISPNPFHQNLLVETNVEISTIQVMDGAGKSVFNVETVNSNSIQIDGSMLESGIYFIHIIGSNGVHEVKRIVKQ